MVLQYYVVITRCSSCGRFDSIRRRINGTSLSQNLSCGQTYVFTVTAVTLLESSTARQTQISLTSANVAVENLTVSYFPANLSDVITDAWWDRFLLTWDPPKNLSPDKIQV